MDQLYANTKLREIVKVDEKYVRSSFKGFTIEKMPKISSHNGQSNLISGISKDQMCIVLVINSHDTLIIKVVGNENASTKMISKALKNKNPYLHSGSD